MKRNITGVFILLICYQSFTTAQWQSLGSGITASPRDIFSMSVVNEEVIWAVAVNYSTNFSYDFTKSLDGGITWTAGLLPDTIGDYFPISIFALDSETAWVLMVNFPQQNKVRLFKTVDGGISWLEQTGEFNKTGFAFSSIHFFDDNEGVGFGSPGTGIASVDSIRIYRTSNGGENWHRILSDFLPTPVAKEGVWLYGDNRYENKGDTLWFGTRSSRVFRTIDRGLSWQAFNTGISGNSNTPGLASIAFQNSQNGIVTTFLPNKAAITNDGGETWTKINIPSSPGAADIEYIPGTSASYIINEGWSTDSNISKFLITHDKGETWETSTFSPALPVIRFLSPSVGYAGGTLQGPNKGGMYKWIGSFTSSTKEVTILDNNVEVFPNPVKDDLKINLSREVTIKNELILRIYDVLGKIKMQVFINSKSTNINIRDLSNGIYLYKLSDKERVLSSGKITKL